MPACVVILLSVPAVPTSAADPDASDPGNYQVPDPRDYNPDAYSNSSYNRPVERLPMIVPTPSNWQPKFPFPYDQTRGSVTNADITAEREMCQWFKAQYYELRRQIDKLQSDRITPNGPGVINGSGSDWDYSRGDLQQEADIVTANIDQSEDFLAPRVQALTQNTEHSDDAYFPLYEGKSFYLLWQHLSNVSAGIKSHQPDWFTGPSVERVKRWGTRIQRSHVCD
ncbi:hypothetical protein [Mycobacterium sp.]|uniref:hypothetical protein n=1 Tax=Mycobacterium sp. TaxID=1785 RepID=UPI003C73F4C3